MPMHNPFRRNKAAAAASSTDDAPSPSTPSSPASSSSSSGLLPPPTTLDLLRYRSHHGVNLGSIFVLEKWLFPGMFEHVVPSGKEGGSGSSELDGVTASVQTIGLEPTRHRWESHWSHALADNNELDNLITSGQITTIRLPLGHFTLGPRFCAGTPFAPVAGVYVNAWNEVLKLCERLYERGVGVLLDLHALPGNANGRDHGGTSDGEPGRFWGSRRYMDLGVKCVEFMVQQVADGRVQGCVGVQIINEAPYAGWDQLKMGKWYDKVLEAVRKIDPEVPIYVSDGWDPKRAVQWSRERCRIGNRGNPLVVAMSKYYCFSEADRGKSPEDLIQGLEKWDQVDEARAEGGGVAGKGAVDTIVTEWSCALDEGSWRHYQGQNREDVHRRFGNAECEAWRRATGGAFFWTAKSQYDLGHWNFSPMVSGGLVTAPAHFDLDFSTAGSRCAKVSAQISQKKDEALGSHSNYWNSTSPGTKFEHHRFGQGWDQAAADVMAFFMARGSLDRDRGKDNGHKTGGDTIGLLELWILKRMREAQQGGPFAWEWEHGFRQGRSTYEEILLQ